MKESSSSSINRNSRDVTVCITDEIGRSSRYPAQELTGMGEIMKNCSERTGIDIRSLRFLCDGSRVCEDSTVWSMLAEGSDCVELDVVAHSFGGGLGNQENEGQAEDEPKTITFYLRDTTDNEQVPFKVKKTTPMQKVMAAWAQHRGIAENTFRLMFDGTKIQGTQTPKMLELEEDDVIDVFLEQIGGSQV